MAEPTPSTPLPHRGRGAPPGNVNAVSHGAWSSALLSPEAMAIKATIIESFPWLGVPAFTDVLDAYAFRAAQAARLRSWLDDKGVIDSQGRERKAARLWLTIEASCDSLRRELGLSPKAAAELRRSLGGGPENEYEALIREGQLMEDRRRQAIATGTE